MKKIFTSQGAIGKAAQKVTNMVGGKGITDYVGGRGTKMGLAKGIANVGMSLGGAGLLRAVTKKAATKVITRGPSILQKAADRKYNRQLDAIWRSRGVNPKKLR